MDFLTRRIVNHLASREGRSLTDAETRFLLSAARDANRGVASCDVDRMRVLLRHEPDIVQTVGPAALYLAVQNRGTEEAVRLLLESGVRSLDLGPGEDSPLHATVQNDNLEALRLVLEAGVCDASAVQQQPTADGVSHLSLLYWVAHLGLATDFVDLLLAHGADPHLPIVGNGERGTTVLHEAVAPPVTAGGVPSVDPVWLWRKHEVARQLIGRKVKPDIYAAAGLDDVETLKSLAKKDDDAIHRPNEGGVTPLHWAARTDAIACATWLLKRRVDIEAATPTQRTAVHLAVDWNHTEMLWLLAGRGADIDAPDAGGRTPLHRAAFLGRVEAVEVLLLLDADRDARDSSDRLPVDLARDGCVDLLQE